MINAIKTIVKNYLSNADLSNMQFATVSRVNPLELQIEKLIIPSTKIIVPTVFAKANIELKKGNRVLVLKQQGGQLFFILDKL